MRYDGFEIENVKFGGLSVSKSVTGTAGDKDAYFNFIVELSDTSINGVYGEMKFVDGVDVYKRQVIYGEPQYAGV